MDNRNFGITEQKPGSSQFRPPRPRHQPSSSKKHLQGAVYQSPHLTDFPCFLYYYLTRGPRHIAPYLEKITDFEKGRERGHLKEVCLRLGFIEHKPDRAIAKGDHFVDFPGGRVLAELNPPTYVKTTRRGSRSAKQLGHNPIYIRQQNSTPFYEISIRGRKRGISKGQRQFGHWLSDSFGNIEDEVCSNRCPSKQETIRALLIRALLL